MRLRFSFFLALSFFFSGFLHSQFKTTSFSRRTTEPHFGNPWYFHPPPGVTWMPNAGYHGIQMYGSDKLAFTGNLTSGQYLFVTDTSGNSIHTWVGDSAHFTNLAVNPDGTMWVGGTTTHHGAGLEDAFIMKVDTGGNVLFFNTYGTADSEVMCRMVRTSDGGVVCSGRKDMNVFALRIDSLGNKLWMKVLMAGGIRNKPGDLIQRADGGFYMSFVQHFASTDGDVDRGITVWLSATGVVEQIRSLPAINEITPSMSYWIENKDAGVALLPSGNMIKMGDYFYYNDTLSTGGFTRSSGFWVQKISPTGASLTLKKSFETSTEIGIRNTYTTNGKYIGNGKVAFCHMSAYGTITYSKWYYLVVADTLFTDVRRYQFGYDAATYPSTLDVGIGIEGLSENSVILSWSTGWSGANQVIQKIPVIPGVPTCEPGGSVTLTNLSLSGGGATFPSFDMGTQTSYPYSLSPDTFSIPFICLKCTTPTLSSSTSLSGLSLTYSGSAIFADTAWWDFGDGTTSALLSGIHTYTPGNYFACLIAENTCGPDTMCHYVDVCNYASFTLSADTLCLGDTIFANQTTSVPVTQTWLLDGALLSIAHDTAAVAGSGGMHYIQLAVYDGVCRDTVVDSFYVHGPASSDFVHDTIVCPGDPVVHTSVVPFVTYAWSTGSVSPVLSAVLPAGGYALTVTDVNGCTYADSFAVSHATDPGNIFPDTSFCGLPSLLMSPGSYAGYAWSTGDTTPAITITSGGSYAVTVSDTVGCTFTDAFHVYDATASFSATYFAGTVVNFTNLSTGAVSHYWDFGDGSPVTTVWSPTHAFPAAATYWVCLYVTDSAGCTQSYCDSVPAFLVVSAFPGLEDTGFRIFPNPNETGLFYVTYTGYEPEDFEIGILDVPGKDLTSLISIEESPEGFLLHCEKLPAGNYLLQLRGENVLETRIVTILSGDN